LALASTPETLSLYNDKGDYYAEVGEIDEAIASYKIAAKESANEKTKILAHTRLGEIYAKTKAFDNARREFETVLVIEPENTIAIVGLGNVAWLLDDLVSAEKYYEMALLLYPDHTIASKNLVAVRELLSSDN
jgi:tetratricopeptide (TPR) repeat protein